MKLCIKCGILYWDKQKYCVICESKLQPYEIKQKRDPSLERALDKYLSGKRLQ